MAITAIQYNAFQDIDDAMHLDNSDHEYLKAIQELLSERGKQQRSSVGLIRQSFNILEDEVLLETYDPVK